MGRYYPVDTSASRPIYSSLTAGEDIKSGDMVTLASDGKAYWATDPAAANAPLRPIYQAADKYFGQVLTGSTIVTANMNAFYDAEDYGTVPLKDGGYLIAWMTGSNVLISIYNNDNSVRVANVTVGSQAFASGTVPSLCARLLNNGNVVIGAPGPNSYMAFWIVGPDGSIVSPGTSLDNANIIGLDCAVLTGGNIVFVFGSGTVSSSFTKYAVVSQSGAVVQAAAILPGPLNYTYPRTCAVSAQTDGTFCVAWCCTGNSGGAYIQKFQATGATAGTAVLLNASGNAQKIIMTPLRDGGYALVHWTDVRTAGDVPIYVIIVSPSLALRTSQLLANCASNIYAKTAALTATSDGGVAVVWCWLPASGSGNVQTVGVAKYGSDGKIVVAQTALWSVPTPSANGNMFNIYPASDNSGSLFIAYVGGSSGYLLQVDSMLNILRGLPNAIPALGAPVLIQVPDSFNSGVVDLIFVAKASPGSTTTQLTVGQYQFFQRAMVPAGVATADAVKGAQIPIMIVGNITIRLSLFKNFVCDYSASGGQKMSVVGNTAIMKGVQP